MAGIRGNSVSHGPGGEDHETRLMELVRAGDTDALRDLMDAYWQPLVAYAYTFVGSHDRAEDLAQETFIRLWERRKEWTPDGSVRSYLYRIVRNLAIDDQRKSKVRRLWAERVKRDPPPVFPPPDDVLEDNELYAAVERAIRELPPRRREVFILRRFHQLSYSQIAEVMGITPRTVANQLSTALAELRATLGTRLDSSP